MVQVLLADPNFETVKESADSIGLLKIIECICYNYQPHEYPPLGAWEALDHLGKTYQPETTSEAEHYETIRTLIKVCIASGVNFALMCTHTVDMAMEVIAKDGNLKGTDGAKINTPSKWNDGGYFALDKDSRELVDVKVEEICIATRLLSLSSTKIFGASKQELKNDLIKGKDNYPRTPAAVLSFLQFHKLTGNGSNASRKANRMQTETGSGRRSWIWEEQEHGM